MLTRKFLFGALLFIVAFSFNSFAPAQTTDEAELTRLEKLWNDSHLKGDADALAQLWDDDLSVIVPKMRPIDKNGGLAMLRSGRFKFTRYETSDLSTRFYGNAAIVTGRVQRTRKMGEREMQDDWHFSKVYIRRNKEWRVVLWQASDEPAQESAVAPSPK